MSVAPEYFRKPNRSPSNPPLISPSARSALDNARVSGHLQQGRRPSYSGCALNLECMSEYGIFYAGACADGPQACDH